MFNMIVGLGVNMSEVVIEFNKVCIFAFCFTVVWCLLLASIDTSVSYNQSQYVHVDSGSGNKKKQQYYFCYCKNGRKDKVIHTMEVSEKTFNNCTVYHDSNDIIHIGRNKVYLDASVSGSSFSKLPDVR